MTTSANQKSFIFMAEIRPFRAWRYNKSLSTQLDELTSPLFDVISSKQRESLYKNPYNSIHLSVPRSISEAVSLLNDWKTKGILVQDTLPTLYVYYQYFSLSGSTKEYCRKGFITHIKAYDWEEKIVLRHENTIPHGVNDRLKLLETLQMDTSPTHGLYEDIEKNLEPYMDEAIQSPLYETEDYQGVREVVAVIHDVLVIKKFIDTLKDKKIILADGHHRYESAIEYRKKMRLANPHHTDYESYNYHLMYLTNLSSEDIRILPTHRLIQHISLPDEKEIIKKIETYFTCKAVDNVYDLQEIILGKKWAFGLVLKNNCYKIRLRPELFSTMSWNFPDVIKELDLTVLHYFIIEKVLGIAGKDQRSSEKIAFNRSLPDCLHLVEEGKAQMALITQAVTMEEIKKVCLTGYTMPQKSTYFYPKVIAGFVFSSLKSDEFESSFNSSF